MRSRRLESLTLLDIDIECLPGHWIGGDYVSKIITAVAWKRIGSKGKPTVLTHYDFTPGEMSELLAAQINDADLVIGHYIRGFDLPLLNGNLMRAGLPPLGPLMTHDTKLDLIKVHGRSQSQENLAAMLGVGAPKVKVTLHEWERFNTRTPGARDKGIERVAGDVIQNIELRARLMELGWLDSPTRWAPSAARKGGYHA